MSKNKVDSGVPRTINFVAKHAGIHRASTHIDLKKQQRTPRKLKNLTIDY
jgi:hypothetical protein